MEQSKSPRTRTAKANEDKWTKPLLKAGWTVFPSIVLEKQAALGLDAVDINILLQLSRFWWFKENLPRPAKSTLAECMDVDPSTIRRHVARMERDGIINGFSGLIGPTAGSSPIHTTSAA